MAEFRRANEWRVYGLPDGTGVAYNPFTGDIYAMSPFALSLIGWIGGDGVSFDKLMGWVAADYPDADSAFLYSELDSNISKLAEIGIVIKVANRS